MRVIAGKYRSRTLAEFSGEAIRPTSDRVKESLFGILTPRLSGARVLDLFCGSGSLGIEAISRGAGRTVFNDYSKESVAVLKKNLAALKITDAEVYCSDFRRLLYDIGGRFDIIFVDPPYKADYADEIFKIVAERNLLYDGGVIVYEREAPVACSDERLCVSDVRRYGRTTLTFIKKKEDDLEKRQ